MLSAVEESLDVDSLRHYLARELPELRGPITARRFSSGYSNLTYAVAVGGDDFVLRRPPFGTKAETAHDMGREVMVLRALEGRFRYVPEVLAYCDDTTILGAPFYLMQRIHGMIIGRDFPDDFELSATLVRKQQECLIDVLAELHCLDYMSAGLSKLGRPEGYVDRQIFGWNKRYKNTQTEIIPDYDEVVHWLTQNIPTSFSPAALIHNDYKLDNVILSPTDPDSIVGVIDWEMATIGDPMMDLGVMLGYWIQPDDPQFMQSLRTMPTNVVGSLTRAEVIARYCDRTGFSVENPAFYFCYGLFRLAVILQQIYYRYFLGQTQDTRFSELNKKTERLIRAAFEVAKDNLV